MNKKIIIDKICLLFFAIAISFAIFKNIGYFAHIKGLSMYPSLKNNQIIFIKRVNPRDLKIGDIVSIKSKYLKEDIVKRIVKIKNNSFYVLGDNAKVSVDSRFFGYIDEKEIDGKVIKF